MCILIEIVILWVYYTIPFSLSFFRQFWGIIFPLFQLLSLAKDHCRKFNTRMCIWSILLIKSDLKKCIHPNRSFFLYFNLYGEGHCWWTKESSRAHVAKFYGRLRLICSDLRASKYAVLKLIEIVIVWVSYTIPFGFSFFRHFWGIIFPLFDYFLWLRITDEGSIPECAYGPYCYLNPILHGVYILVEVSFYISNFGIDAICESNKSAGAIYTTRFYLLSDSALYLLRCGFIIENDRLCRTFVVEFSTSYYIWQYESTIFLSTSGMYSSSLSYY